MRTIYHAYSDEYGECEAMFDKDGTMIGYWHGNDATWRNEYFSGFMRELGFQVENAPEWIIEKLDEFSKSACG